MSLDDVEGSAKNISKRARLFDVAGLQINRKDDIRSKKQGALDRHGRGQESVDQRATLKLDGHKKSRVCAGSAQRRRDRSVRIVDGNACGDVRGGDSQRRLQFLKGLNGRKARDIFFHALIRG